MKLDVVFSPQEISQLANRDLSQTVCVVFDVLRATSSMLTALANGVTEIHPVASIEEAQALKQKFPDALLCGERDGEKIEGFDLGNSPFEYADIPEKRVITTTTNGTVALRACANAQRVIVGALLNLDAVVSSLTTMNPETVLLVCAGTRDETALEDVVAAGGVCAALLDAEMTDAAKLAEAVFQKYEDDLFGALGQSKNGRALMAKGRQEEVQRCAQRSVYGMIGEMREGVVSPIATIS